MFLSKHIASKMRWHKDKQVDIEDVLQHPVDATRWKYFDRKFSQFSSESRNLHLGLASNGFNPFWNMHTTYSIWLVVFIPYNSTP